jgi:hypothetical protein
MRARTILPMAVLTGIALGGSPRKELLTFRLSV